MPGLHMFCHNKEKKMEIDPKKKKALAIYFILFGVPGILAILAIIIVPLFTE